MKQRRKELTIKKKVQTVLKEAKALDLNPFDAETAYALAKGEARLEQLYQHLYSGMEETRQTGICVYLRSSGFRPCEHIPDPR